MFNYFAQTKENKANFLEAQVPNKRIGTPEEIANAIVFIGSVKASYKQPPYSEKRQPPPGSEEEMSPRADHGESSGTKSR